MIIIVLWYIYIASKNSIQLIGNCYNCTTENNKIKYYFLLYIKNNKTCNVNKLIFYKSF